MTVHAYYARQEKTMPTNGNGHAKFTPGPVAEIIALARPGEEVPSGFKPFRQMRYDLEDGRTWYAALATGVKLHNLELGVGEPFRVCKRAFGVGGSVIDVLRCNPATPQRPAPQPSPLRAQPDATGTVLEAKLQASIAAVSNRQGPGVRAAISEVRAKDVQAPAKRRSPAQPPPPAAATAPSSDPDDPGPGSSAPGGMSSANGNGHKPAPPALMTGQGQFYLDRATEYIDVVAAAFNYAITAHNGMFSKDDIRAMFATVYIQHTGKHDNRGGR